MRGGGRLATVIVAILVGGMLVLAGGCAKLKSSMDKRETVTVGGLAAKVDALEQAVADLQFSVAQVSSPRDVSDLTRSVSAGTKGRFAVGSSAVVTAKFLNVRQDPRTDALRVGVLKNDAVVQILDVQGDWARIATASGEKVSGWVAHEFLKPAE